MKKLVYIAAGLMITAGVLAKANSEINTNNEINLNQVQISNAYYGVNLYKASTGSGYGSSTNLNFNVQKFNKVFELGVMVGTKDNKIQGVEFLYKHFFGFRSGNFYKRTIRPFFNYNFIYRMPSQIIVSSSYVNSNEFNPADVNGKITTFEHALGLGAQVNILKKVYVEGTVDFGVYLGSHYKGATPNTWGIHNGNCGFVPSFKLGFGFQF
jgi:hypothetical protein